MDTFSDSRSASLWLLSVSVAVLLFAASGFGQALMETQELAFPHMAIGGIWESELTIVAQGADTSSGTIIFFTQKGEAMAVSANGGAPVTCLE